jgi:nucleotide-binding universal stress UspA family protein
MLRHITGADLTLLHAWTVFGGSVLRSRLPADEFREYVESARLASQAAMSAFATTLADQLSGVPTQLIEGEPERAISRFVEANDVDLVVMGTVARSGIPGLVMGNTAERVLQRLSGSVFAIKPPGFVTPVGRE